MKMKRACEATGLTERAIRLYIKKGLIVPRMIGEVIDFDAADIRLLRDIAVLRRFDFTIEQIMHMIREPERGLEIVRQREEGAREEYAHAGEVVEVLSALMQEDAASMHGIAMRIGKGRVQPAGPDFGRLDGNGVDAREKEAKAAMEGVLRRGRKRRLMIAAICMLAILAAGLAVFMGWRRVSGQMSIAPVEIREVYADGTALIGIGNMEAVQILGRDEIRAEVRLFGAELMAGDEYGKGCQLSVRLSNGDLARIGICPLQRLESGGAREREEWMKMVLRMMFLDGEDRGAAVWIGESANMGPLFRWK